jgi:hypothetical protein
MKNLALICILVMAASGCASNQVYNPVTSSLNQTFLLNESSLAQIKPGMKQSMVHQIMGDSIVIGYAYQKPVTDESVVSQASSSDYKPLTIANPYKTEDVKGKDGVYTVEYYVNAVKQSDGVITDDELVPLIFHDGTLLSRGWDSLKALHLKNPA